MENIHYSWRTIVGEPRRAAINDCEKGQDLHLGLCARLQYHARDMNQRRPSVITLLAVLDYSIAAFSLGYAIVCLLPAGARSAGLGVLDRVFKSDLPNSSTHWSPVALASLCLLVSIIKCCIGAGLWKLKNWARIVTILITVPLSGRLPSALGVINALFPVPGPYLLGYALSFALFLYLVSPGVRTAFGVTTPRRKWLVPAVSALVLACLAFDLYSSGPEFDAMVWHMRHGNRVSLNGVTFPIYFWYKPVQEHVGGDFTIDDNPGPMRKKDAYGAYIWVNGDTDVKNLSSVEKRLDEKVQGYQRSGYTDINKFQLRISEQTLACLKVQDVVTNKVDCFGDGPITSVSFGGGNRSLERFQLMMSEAE